MGFEASGLKGLGLSGLGSGLRVESSEVKGCGDSGLGIRSAFQHRDEGFPAEKVGALA